MIKSVTLKSYEENQLSTQKIVLLFFWAQNCGASRMLSPVIRRLDDEYRDRILIGTVNIEKEIELAEQLGVMFTPTVLVQRNNKVFDKAIGAKPIAFYRKMITKARENT